MRSRAGLLHVEARRVNRKIGEIPDGCKWLSFARDTFPNRIFSAQRMRAPRFAEAAHQRIVAELREKSGECSGRARIRRNIAEKRESPEPSRTSTTSAPLSRSTATRIPHQIGKLRDQFDGQVVHRVVAEVFERAQGNGTRLPEPLIPVMITSSVPGLPTGAAFATTFVAAAFRAV